MNRKYLFVTCPKCGAEAAVVARGYNVQKLDIPVMLEPTGEGEHEAMLAWDEADIESDFVYECSECSYILALSREQLNRNFEKDIRRCSQCSE